MDLSPEYIKMCEKALRFLPLPEVLPQGQWLKYTGKNIEVDHEPLCVGTVVERFKCGTQKDHIQVFDGFDGQEYCDLKDFIPLWTQDQLQEIVWNRALGPFAFIGAFSHFVDINARGDESMEQLWLAFVMKEKFNKTWDNVLGEWTND